MSYINEDIFKEVLSRSVRSHVTYTDSFAEQRSSTLITLENGSIERISSGKDTGIGLRSISENSSNYSFSNDLSPETIFEMVAAISKDQDSTKRNIFDLTQKNPSSSLPVKEYPSEIPLQSKIQLLKLIDSTARKFDTSVKQVSVTYSDLVQDVYVGNSNHTFSTEIRTYILLGLNVIATDGKVIQTGRETIGGMTGFELFNSINIEEVTLRAAERAIRMLHSRHAPSGRMPVVIASEAGGTIIHEAVGRGLEADLAQNGLSVFRNKLSKSIASPLVNIVDDSTLPGMRGSFLFDDEGTPSQRTVLVENGILKGFMYDILTSTRDNTLSTGNGRRQSYRHRPIPRMTNTILLPGHETPENILKGIHLGLFVNKLGGGQVNTVTGDFVFEVQDGRMIINGKPGEHVRGATLTGNGPDTLLNIDMIGNDLGFPLAHVVRTLKEFQ